MKLFPCAVRRVVGLIVRVVTLAFLPGSSLHAAAVSEEPRSAPTLYSKYCAKCHKTDGTGSKNLSTAAPDFTRLAWQRDRTDLQLRISIRDGKGHAMPAFVDRFSDKEVNALVAHIRGFAPSDRENGASIPAAEFEERFQKLEWELAELRREFWELHGGSKQKKTDDAPAKESGR
jgi:mono/diheme cytochrome c family protein